MQEPPFCAYIRLNRCERMASPEAQANYIKQLQGDFIVAADGAGSLSRQGFKGAFVCSESKGAHAGEERIRLGQTDDNLEEADYALGIILREDACPPQPQSLNVVFTLAENIYLLNSQQGSKGFLNIRITKEEYDAIYEATGRRGCSFGSPIRIDFPEAVDDGTGPAFAKVNLPWLRRRIEEGLKLFGMRTEHMVGITGFQLVPAYVQHFCHVLPADEHVDKARVLLLAGDAAISHHFWPGRGLNTGLKSVKAIIRMFESETAMDGLQRYNTFMKKLRTREMQGRSASMMQKSLRLDWGPALTCMDPANPGYQELVQEATRLEEENRQKFLQQCKLWRDFLQRNQEAWPHAPIEDEVLERAITRAVAKPKALELHLMVKSAAENGPNRAAGWTTSMQKGAEVDPANDEHWR